MRSSSNVIVVLGLFQGLCLASNSNNFMHQEYPWYFVWLHQHHSYQVILCNIRKQDHCGAARRGTAICCQVSGEEVTNFWCLHLLCFNTICLLKRKRKSNPPCKDIFLLGAFSVFSSNVTYWEILGSTSILLKDLSMDLKVPQEAVTMFIN